MGLPWGGYWGLMTNSTLYAQADPTGLDSYNTTEDNGVTFGVTFQVNADGLLKEIWFYSPNIGGTGSMLPDKVGLFVADTLTAVFEDTPVWSGAEGSGWVSTTVDSTSLVTGTDYIAVCSNTSGGSPTKRAYLYQGTNQLIPATSTDGNVESLASLSGLANGPNGPSHPYVNSAFAYPATPGPGAINWLVDVGVQFTPPGPLTIDTTSFPDASKLYAYSQTATGEGGETPYAWSISTGSLPSGLSLNSSTGAITGSPTTTGTSNFTLRLTDHASTVVTKPLSITVDTILIGSPSTVSGISTYAVTAGINNTSDAGPQDIRVLPPTDPAVGRPHAFLWVLPVEPGQGTTFGDGIGTMKTLGIHNTYNLTCVQPGFPIDPWYIDNDTDPQTQQDSYVMALLAWAEDNLGSGGEKHYIIGFSKSGFGGQEMFFHHQDVFDGVVSWDGAVDYETMESYDGADAIGSQDNLTANTLYPPHLATWKAEGDTATVNRIFIAAGHLYVDINEAYDARLTTAGIMHTYTEVSTSTHNWSTTPDWVAPNVALMLGDAVQINGVLGSVFI